MRWPLLTAIFLLAACGAAPTRATTVRTPATSMVDDSDDDDGDEVCKDERMTGTNVSKVVCRSQAEIDEERNAAMTWEKHPRNDTGH